MSYLIFKWKNVTHISVRYGRIGYIPGFLPVLQASCCIFTQRPDAIEFIDSIARLHIPFFILSSIFILTLCLSEDQAELQRFFYKRFQTSLAAVLFGRLYTL